MALTMRQFKFLCLVAREFRIGENNALEYSIAYPFCAIATHCATHAIPSRYISNMSTLPRGQV
jgi:hypothetical protein